MDEFDRHGAFADSGGDAFGGPMPDIARDKDSRHAGLKIERIAIRRPSGRALAFEHQMLAGNQIALRVPLDDSGEPIRARHGARINQQRAGRTRFPSRAFCCSEW